MTSYPQKPSFVCTKCFFLFSFFSEWRLPAWNLLLSWYFNFGVLYIFSAWSTLELTFTSNFIIQFWKNRLSSPRKYWPLLHENHSIFLSLSIHILLPVFSKTDKLNRINGSCYYLGSKLIVPGIWVSNKASRSTLRLANKLLWLKSNLRLLFLTCWVWHTLWVHTHLNLFKGLKAVFMLAWILVSHSEM